MLFHEWAPDCIIYPLKVLSLMAEDGRARDVKTGTAFLPVGQVKKRKYSLVLPTLLLRIISHSWNLAQSGHCPTSSPSRQKNLQVKLLSRCQLSSPRAEYYFCLWVISCTDVWILKKISTLTSLSNHTHTRLLTFGLTFLCVQQNNFQVSHGLGFQYWHPQGRL